jgi:hypothetical protein
MDAVFQLGAGVLLVEHFRHYLHLSQRFAAFSPNLGIGLGSVAGEWGRAMTKLTIDVVLFCSGLPFVTVLVIAAANALR